MKLKTRLRSIYRRYLKFWGFLSTLIAFIVLILPPHANILIDAFFALYVTFALLCWGWEYRANRLSRWLKVYQYKCKRIRGSVFGVSYDICRSAESEMRALGEVYNIPDNVISEHIKKVVDIACKTIEKL